MCEQCCADTKTYAVIKDDKAFMEILPGFVLIRASQDGMFMKKGDWALVSCNDPEVYWSETPTKDPEWGMTEEESDAQPEEFQKLASQWIDQSQEFRDRLQKMISPYMSWKLVNEAMKQGYTWEEHGPFGFWLWHKMGEWLEQATPVWDQPGVTDLKLNGKTQIVEEPGARG